MTRASHSASVAGMHPTVVGGPTGWPAQAGAAEVCDAAGAPLAPEVPACLACGACCFSTAADYVRVAGADWSRLGADADHWAQFVNNRAFMRMTAGHCAALVIGKSAVTGQMAYTCEIYERRPQVCRDLERGSPSCAAELERKAGVARAAAVGAS